MKVATEGSYFAIAVGSCSAAGAGAESEAGCQMS